MKYTPPPVRIIFKRYKVLSSIKDTLFTGRVIVELGSFRFTKRFIPYFSAYVSIIRPNDQND